MGIRLSEPLLFPKNFSELRNQSPTKFPSPGLTFYTGLEQIPENIFIWIKTLTFSEMLEIM